MIDTQTARFFILQDPPSSQRRLSGSATSRPKESLQPQSHNISNIPARKETMESINIPTDNVPAELKSCDQILKRAKELKKAEPVVAYWCKIHRINLQSIADD